MTTGGWVRRILGALAAAMVLMVVAVSPARAATTGSTSGIGFWQLPDANSTAVSVQAVDGPGKQSTLFVFVTQRFCDTATDTAVFRGAQGQVNVNPGAFVAHPHLKQARLKASLTVNVVDQRLSSCASPSGFPTTVPRGMFPLSIDVDWTATGPLMTVQPGVVSRAATARGTLASAGVVGGRNGIGLGNSVFAELRQSES